MSNVNERQGDADKVRHAGFQGIVCINKCQETLGESLRIRDECSELSFVGMAIAELTAILKDKIEKIMLLAVGSSQIGIGDLVQAKKRSDVRMCHGPLCRKSEELPRPDIARSVKSADVAVPGSGDSPIRSLSATEAEFN